MPWTAPKKTDTTMSRTKEGLFSLDEYEDMAHGPICGTGTPDPYDLWLEEQEYEAQDMAQEMCPEYDEWTDSLPGAYDDELQTEEG